LAIGVTRRRAVDDAFDLLLDAFEATMDSRAARRH
jgi:hypothetical protein